MNTTGGSGAEYPVSAGTQPFGIVGGPDGNVWFTEAQRNLIGRMSTERSPVGTINGSSRFPPRAVGHMGLPSVPTTTYGSRNPAVTTSAALRLLETSPSFPSRRERAILRASLSDPTTTCGWWRRPATRSAESRSRAPSPSSTYRLRAAAPTASPPAPMATCGSQSPSPTKWCESRLRTSSLSIASQRQGAHRRNCCGTRWQPVVHRVAGEQIGRIKL